MKSPKHLSFSGLASLLWLLASSGSLFAQGASTTVGGLTTTPTRVSAASSFWNPAAIGPARGTTLDTNITLFSGWLIYDRDGTDPRTGQGFDSSLIKLIAPNPFLAVASDFGLKNWRFAYSTYFPAGAIANYPRSGSQRYEVIDGMYIPWNHQLTVAYNLNDEWSIGGSFMYSLAFFRANFDIDLAPVLSKIMDTKDVPRESMVLASPARIPVSTAHSFTGSLGVLYRPNVSWSFGAAFVFPSQHVFKQMMRMQRPRGFSILSPALSSLGLEENFNHRGVFTFKSPAMLNMGFRFQPVGYYTSEYFGRYTFGSKAPFANVKFTDSSIAVLEDSSIPGSRAKDSISIGSVQSFELWRPLQAGVMGSYSSSGVPEQSVSPARVGFNTFTLGLFGRYRWSENLRTTAEYAHSFILSRKIDDASVPPSSLELYEKPLGNGSYRAGMMRFGLSVNYDF